MPVVFYFSFLVSSYRRVQSSTLHASPRISAFGTYKQIPEETSVSMVIQRYSTLFLTLPTSRQPSQRDEIRGMTF